jgi:SOS-response transcriptional repressor LexA
MSRPISPQQQKVLDYLVKFYVMNDALPTSPVIAKAFGYASTNAAHEMVLQLVSKGFLERNENNTYRFSRKLPHPGHAQIIEAHPKPRTYSTPPLRPLTGIH